MIPWKWSRLLVNNHCHVSLLLIQCSFIYPHILIKFMLIFKKIVVHVLTYFQRVLWRGIASSIKAQVHALECLVICFPHSYFCWYMISCELFVMYCKLISWEPTFGILKSLGITNPSSFWWRKSTLISLHLLEMGKYFYVTTN